MKNKNIVLARNYIKRFYEFLSLSMDKKEIKALRRNVEKYEDVSYIKNIINDDLKNNIKKNLSETKEAKIAKNTQIMEDLQSFYDNFFLNREIIDIPVVRKELAALDAKLLYSNNEDYLEEITQLYEFKNNIEVELSVYVQKHKSEEYMDMSVFHKSVTENIKSTKDIIIKMNNDYQLDLDEYCDKYIEFVYRQYNIIFENASGKTRSLPQWAKGLLFCVPWIIGFIAFTVIPLIQTLMFSFSTVTLSTSGFKTTWAGIDNYKNIFTSDTDFILALKNYLVEMLVYVPLITIFSLALAMLLNSKIKTKGFFRTIFFFPVIVTSGPVIKILIEQGVTAMPGVEKMMDLNAVTASMPELVRIAFNILTSEFTMILWFSGIQILVFVTALQKIDKGVYEASAIDGANKWEQFWKVTLPAINPTIVINVVFTTVMQSIFALNPIILKIQSDMNDTSEGKGYGYSSALAFTYFIIMIAVLVIFVLLFKRHERRNKEVH